MSSTDSASIATDKITIKGKQLWHLFARSIIFCVSNWKPVLILSLFYTFVNTAASTIYFNSIISIAPGLIDLFQTLEQLDNAKTFDDMLAIGFYFLQPGNFALLFTFVAATFIIWLIFSCFIMTLVGIAWYRYILASGDEKILRSVFRWSNKHSPFFIWQLILSVIMMLALVSLIVGFAGAFYIFYMASALPFAIAFMLGILTFSLLFLCVYGVFLRASLIFPCLAISSEISIKQIFNKTTSNFNTFCLLIPLQVILVILGTYILMLLLAQLTTGLLNINLNENISITSRYSDVSGIIAAFIVNTPAALCVFWLATFVMFIASHFFPALFKSAFSK